MCRDVGEKLKTARTSLAGCGQTMGTASVRDGRFASISYSRSRSGVVREMAHTLPSDETATCDASPSKSFCVIQFEVRVRSRKPRVTSVAERTARPCVGEWTICLVTVLAVPVASRRKAKENTDRSQTGTLSCNRFFVSAICVSTFSAISFSTSRPIFSASISRVFS